MCGCKDNKHSLFYAPPFCKSWIHHWDPQIYAYTLRLNIAWLWNIAINYAWILNHSLCSGTPHGMIGYARSHRSHLFCNKLDSSRKVWLQQLTAARLLVSCFIIAVQFNCDNVKLFTPGYSIMNTLALRRFQSLY